MENCGAEMRALRFDTARLRCVATALRFDTSALRSVARDTFRYGAVTLCCDGVTFRYERFTLCCALLSPVHLRINSPHIAYYIKKPLPQSSSPTGAAVFIFSIF